MARIVSLSLLVAALTVSLVPPAAAQTTWQDAYNGQTAEERELLRCVNRERSRAKIPLLSFSPPLHQAARLHARQMRDHDFFSHTDQRGRGPKERVAIYAGPTRFTYVGENIAAGFSAPQSACNALVASSGHYRNMVNPSFTRIGTGYASGGGTYGRYYVQVFSRHTQ